MRNAALMTVALALLCTTPAFAGGGGGGAKANARITFRNNGNRGIAVITKLSQADLNAAGAALANPVVTVAQVQAQGGFFIEPGRTVTKNFTPNTQVFFGTGASIDIANQGVQPGVNTFVGDRTTGGAGSNVQVAINASNAGQVPAVAKVFLDYGREMAFASLGLGGIAALGLVSFMLNRKKA